MGRNTFAAGAVGFVLALAVVGLGYLLLSKGQPPERPAPPAAEGLPVVPAQRAGTTGPTAEELARAQPAALQPPAGSASAAGAFPAPPAAPRDLAAQLQEILAAFDRLMQSPAGAGPIGPEQVRSLQEREQRYGELVQRLAALGPAVLPLLMEQFERDGRAGRIERQMFLVRGMAAIGGEEAIQALARAFDATEQWGLRMTIVSELARHGGAAGTRLLSERLLTEPDARIRAAILKFVGQQGTPEAAALAARLARGDADTNVRVAAVRALGESGQREQAAPVLEELARTASELVVRQNAVQVYGRLLGEQAVPLLEDLVRTDPNVRIRAVAILTLQEVGGERARAVLEAVANDPLQSEDVRARARGALAALERGQRLGPIGLEGMRPVRIEGLKPIGRLGEDDKD